MFPVLLNYRLEDNILPNLKMWMRLFCWVVLSREKHDILMELFTAAEREERMRGVGFLRERGVEVEFIGQQSREVD